jgi:hypothetical protein
MSPGPDDYAQDDLTPDELAAEYLGPLPNPGMFRSSWSFLGSLGVIIAANAIVVGLVASALALAGAL